MNHESRLPNLDELLMELVDGELTPVQQLHLMALLRDDPAAREKYLNHLGLDALLAWELSSAIKGPEQIAGDGRRIGGPAARGRPWLPLSIAAGAWIIAVLSLGLYGYRTRIAVSNPAADTKPRPAPAGPHADADAVVAVLVNEAGAQFAGHAVPPSVRVGPGAYHLTGGTVHLRFTSGVDVVIRAPARYMVHDPFHIALTEGVLRAIVPDSAHGFTISAPGVDYEDLGTEFGVVAIAGRRESELHVFEGRVDLKKPGGERIAQVPVGKSVRFVNGEVKSKTPGDLDRFPSPGAIGLERWNQWRESFSTDPSLICYFPFLEDAKDDRLLRDWAAHGQSVQGRIRGARWVSGRWAGKQALLFDRDEDTVELTLPGGLRQMTTAAWVNVDRLEYAWNAILGSDGWAPGGFLWQLTRSRDQRAANYDYWRLYQPDGQLERISRMTHYKTAHGNSQVPLGQWVHLAAVVDLDRSTIRVFTNGELCSEFSSIPFPPGLTLNPGRCRMGNWLPDVGWTENPKRGLRARIDEFAVWRRALSEGEIRQHAAAGWPSLVYAVGLVDTGPDDRQSMRFQEVP